MKRLQTATLAAAVALLASTLGSAGSAPAAGDPAKTTVDAIRTVGAALFFWARDNGPKSERKDSATSAAQIATIPAISDEELAKMLVPKYLPSLTLTDGWGHRLDVRFDGTLTTTPAMSVRSPGADGKFDGDAYPVGSFDPADANADVVWADGYFVRWPAKK